VGWEGGEKEVEEEVGGRRGDEVERHLSLVYYSKVILRE
jgi:hypothetical protein